MMTVVKKMVIKGQVIITLTHEEIFDRYGLDCCLNWGDKSLTEDEVSGIIEDVTGEVYLSHLPVIKVIYTSGSVAPEFHGAVACGLDIFLEN